MTNTLYISWRSALLILQTILAVGIFGLHQPRRIKSIPLRVGVVLLVSLLCNGVVKTVHDLGTTPEERRFYWSICVVFIFLLCIGCTALLYRVNWATSLLMASVGYAAQNIAGSVKNILRLIPAGEGFGGTLAYELLLDGVAYAGSYFILYLIFSGTIRNNQEDFDNEIKAWFALAVIVLRVLTYKMPEEASVQTNAAVIADSLRSIGVRFLLLMVQFGTLQNHQLNRDVDAMKELIHLQQQQFDATRESSSVIEEKYHDLKKMLDGFAGRMPEEGLADLKKALLDHGAAVKTGNEVLDIILTQKRLICQKENIRLTCIADRVDLGFMGELDQYALFNNAVSNAIEAVQRIPPEQPRYITFSLRQEGDLVFFHGENPCADAPQYCGGLPQTQKDRNYHGFGMKSMERTAEKYGGTLSALYRDGMFFLDVVLSR